MRKFFLLIIFFFVAFALLGCNTDETYNEYGIKEKQMNSLISILNPEIELPLNDIQTSTSIRLHFINNNITFEAYSNDGYFTNDIGFDIKGMSLSYQGCSYVDVNWRYSITKGTRVQGDFCYINFIVKESDNIIGYIVVKNYQATTVNIGYAMYKTEVKKAIVFPDVIDGKNIMSYSIVNSLINQENNYYDVGKNPINPFSNNYEFITEDYDAINLPRIVEKDKQLMLEDAFDIHFNQVEFEYHIYSEDAYFIQGDKTSHYIVVDAYEEWYQNEEKTYKSISLYWDCTKEEEQNDIKAIAPTYIYIFVIERNNLMGVARVCLEKTNNNLDYCSKYQLYVKTQEKYFSEWTEGKKPSVSIEKIYDFFKELEGE